MKNSKFNLTEIMNNRSVRRQQEQVDGQITIQDWLEWKEDIKNRLQETSENFVVIGYRLKQIRESRMFEKDGYKTLSEFAQKEYNLSRTVVDRLIKINDRFSEDGNSLKIKEEYRNYGYSKLQEMLYLTKEELEEVTDEMTVREVRQIRTERNAKQQEENREDQEGAPQAEPPEENREAAGMSGDQRKCATSHEDDEWREEKPERKPIELPPKDAVYREKLGKTMLQEITEGGRRYAILKMKHKYRVGNTLLLMECEKGKRTGKVVEIKITHMTDDSGGIVPGYCVIGFQGFQEFYEEVREDED